MHDDTGSGTALAPAVTAVLGSDPHDFAGLYIRHRTSFTSHARRYLRDPRDADEVVQEAFLRLFLAMPELESELQALAYCRRTITNLCIDRYRADARRPRLVALEGAPVEDLAEDDTGDPVVRAEDAALVRAALSQLPALHRAALVKREIEEKPLPVIADELDVAEDSVKHLLFRARRTLRKLLAGTSVAPGIDLELTRGLRPAARGASGGVAGLLLLALLGLGSGPDLRSVPVVGVDLPDVLGVTAVADAVGGAVRDVVGVLVPGEKAQASAAGREPADRPVGRSQPLAPATADQPAGPAGASGAGTPGRGPAGLPGAPGGANGSETTTTVVTVVDGVPVMTTVPAPSGQMPGADGGAAVQGTAPGTSTGRAAGPSLPVPVGPRLPAGGLELPAAGTVPPVVPGAAAPATSARTDDAVKAADKAADRAADAAERAAKAADKDAEKTAKAAQKEAEKAADVAQKAGKAAEQAAERAPKDGQQAADKALKDAQQVAEKAQKDAQQAAERAERAAEKASKDAAKEAERAADRAADRAAAQREAAERAAARAAEQAAERAAAERAAAERAAEQAAEHAPAAGAASAVVSATAP